ncbi:MAG: hypothetical protein ACOCYE_13770 [Pseudomonadota bacterium]
MAVSDAGERRREAWQAKLLPLMAGMLVLAAVFFAVTSIVELRSLYQRVEQRPLDLATSFADFEALAPAGTAGELAYLRFKTLALLEADALHRRYHQANATMLARVWTRQLGFLTGMILALVGAAFVLGRLQESTSTLEIEAKGTKAAMASASPGLVLAALGALLMGIALVVPFGIETRDVATYLVTAGDGASNDLPPPVMPRTLVDPAADPGPAPPLPRSGG